MEQAENQGRRKGTRWLAIGRAVRKMGMGCKGDEESGANLASLSPL